MPSQDNLLDFEAKLDDLQTDNIDYMFVYVRPGANEDQTFVKYSAQDAHAPENLSQGMFLTLIDIHGYTKTKEILAGWILEIDKIVAASKKKKKSEWQNKLFLYLSPTFLLVGQS